MDHFKPALIGPIDVHGSRVIKDKKYHDIQIVMDLPFTIMRVSDQGCEVIISFFA